MLLLFRSVIQRWEIHARTRKLPPASRCAKTQTSVSHCGPATPQTSNLLREKHQSLTGASDCYASAQQADFQNGFPSVTKPEGSLWSRRSHPQTLCCRPGRSLWMRRSRAGPLQRRRRNLDEFLAATQSHYICHQNTTTASTELVILPLSLLIKCVSLSSDGNSNAILYILIARTRPLCPFKPTMENIYSSVKTMFISYY